MSLAPGTALQNGQYVIDALLEAAPNGDLYWGTHVVTGMQVFIQRFPVLSDSSGSDLPGLMSRLEGIAFAQQSPLPDTFQIFQEDDHTLCLAMGHNVGLPWSAASKTYPPLSPKRALKTIRQIAQDLVWLKSQGLSGLDLSPNRIWLADDRDHAILTGLPQAHLDVAAETATPDSSVQFLARLLYAFLTGKIEMPVATADLQTSLQDNCPNLSPLIAQAIVSGGSETAAPDLTLAQWLDQLPDADHRHILRAPEQTANPGQPPHPQSQPAAPARPKKRYSALAVTALFAAIAGVAGGTVWRFNAESLPGAIQLEPDQSFPTQADWPGDSPAADFDTPFVPARDTPLPREEWYEPEPAPVPVETPVWESPANAAEWPDPAEIIEPPIDVPDIIAPETDLDFPEGEPVEDLPSDEPATPVEEPSADTVPVAPIETPAAADNDASFSDIRESSPPTVEADAKDNATDAASES